MQGCDEDEDVPNPKNKESADKKGKGKGNQLLMVGGQPSDPKPQFGKSLNVGGAPQVAFSANY